jgi:prepilin-type N-terminal cleavage/methylation domain-containing protein
MKKSSNKGFSLIELIIAIAILVILTGLLAPQFMRYIEKSREAKDMQTLDTVYEAVQVALTDEKAYEAVMSSSADDMTTGIALSEILGNSDDFSKEVQENLGNLAKDSSKLTLTSKKAKACATSSPVICVIVNNKVTEKTENGQKVTTGSDNVAVGVYCGETGKVGCSDKDFNLGVATVPAA